MKAKHDAPEPCRQIPDHHTDACILDPSWALLPLFTAILITSGLSKVLPVKEFVDTLIEALPKRVHCIAVEAESDVYLSLLCELLSLSLSLQICKFSLSSHQSRQSTKERLLGSSDLRQAVLSFICTSIPYSVSHN